MSLLVTITALPTVTHLSSFDASQAKFKSVMFMTIYACFGKEFGVNVCISELLVSGWWVSLQRISHSLTGRRPTDSHEGTRSDGMPARAKCKHALRICRPPEIRHTCVLLHCNVKVQRDSSTWWEGFWCQNGANIVVVFSVLRIWRVLNLNVIHYHYMQQDHRILQSNLPAKISNKPSPLSGWITLY